ncbi:MAG: MBL fold metallo-hydrolase [Caldilineaceae bacterium]|nr:MBL fold metallo-hydrolase [Caldilineaceae bacterium]
MRLHPRIYLAGSAEFGLSDAWDCHVYVVDGGSELAMIDAGGGRPASYAMIRRNLLEDGLEPARIRHIILTHSHTDHARGAAGWRAELGARVYLPETERALLEMDRAGSIPCPVDVGIQHGDRIAVGDLCLEAIQVPGHSPGICAYLLEVDGYRALFAADIVFQNGLIGLINYAGSELAPYREFLPRLANRRVDALLPGHLLFTLRNGQQHIDLALEQMQRGFVPLSIGQLDVIFRSPADY